MWKRERDQNMPLLRVHFSIVQISPRLDWASFKNPSCIFTSNRDLKRTVSKQDGTYRESIFCSHSSFLARGRLTRISASPGGVEHLDIPVWSLHNARCALEFCAARVKSAAVVFVHRSRSWCRKTRRSSRRWVPLPLPIRMHPPCDSRVAVAVAFPWLRAGTDLT